MEPATLRSFTFVLRSGMNTEASRFLEKYRDKIKALSERFASGQINRQQFEALFAHYQANIERIERITKEKPGTEDWKQAIAEGHSILLQRAHQARLTGYTIFLKNGNLIRNTGNNEIDPARMLSFDSEDKARKSPFFAKCVPYEMGKKMVWLCFIYGECSLAVMTLSHEAAQVQLERLIELHEIFENANRNRLVENQADWEILVYPQEFFLNKVL
jgi:hypothetical protein